MRLGRRLSVVVTAGLLAGAAACSSDDRSAGRFCAELAEALPSLNGPIALPSDVEAIVDTYERLDEITPITIEREWRQLTELVQTAATVQPDDPDSVQRVADRAYATERSARALATWVAQTCGLELPAVIGVEGSTPPATTVPPVPATDG
jgi:hypothetical protein